MNCIKKWCQWFEKEKICFLSLFLNLPTFENHGPSIQKKKRKKRSFNTNSLHDFFFKNIKIKKALTRIRISDNSLRLNHKLPPLSYDKIIIWNIIKLNTHVENYDYNSLRDILFTSFSLRKGNGNVWGSRSSWI